MDENSTKQEQFKQELNKLDVDIPIEEILAKDLESISPFSSAKFESQTPVNLNLPFPELTYPNEDDQKTNTDKYSENAYIPQPLSPIVVNRRRSSGADFDFDIKESILNFIEENSLNPEINVFVFNKWYDLTKSEPGLPGKKLAEMLKELPKEKIAEDSLNQIFNQLDDLRTSILTQETAILFYISTITLLHGVADDSVLFKRCIKMCNKAISTASKVIGDKMLDIYKKAIVTEQSSENIFEFAKQLKTTKDDVIDKGGKFLYQCLVDYVDCKLANDAIINHLASTLSKAVRANTNLSTIETENQTKLRRFQQSLLVVIASELVLNGTEEYKDLVPLISPNLIYMILCNIKPDEMMPQKIDYNLIDRFMKQSNCNLSLRTDEILFKQPEYTGDDLIQVYFE